VTVLKIRLDKYLFEHNMVPSRERGQALIMSGIVYVNDVKADKAGDMVSEDARVEIRGSDIPYVSRGGLKLEKAMEVFPIKLDDCLCMDVGASTGGFTDCMLQNGARKVYAVDVGYGQLAWKLRTDERVVNMERTNFRYVTKEQVPDTLNFASVDVSFISLSLIIPVMKQLMDVGSTAVCLIKPQFEAGRENVGKKGVVRDKNVHILTVQKTVDMMLANGFSILGLTFSPIKGPEGNIEYLAYIRLDKTPANLSNTTAEIIVNASHQELDK
jgi:23S rRNA (cytidine1920-2'-O)/16S rRNA (cytidine1409-2'-O)-methyltransferase